MTTNAGDALTALLASIDLVRRSIRPLDCGHHYCRYCEAGTSNNWEHHPSCPYELSIQETDEAKRLVDAVIAEKMKCQPTR